MKETGSILFEDTPPYDRGLVAAALMLPVVVMSPIFLLMAYSEPSLTTAAVLLVFGVPLLVILFTYGLGIPAKVTVTKDMVEVVHGLVFRIRIPIASITSSSLRPPPWWLNLYYLFSNAQWVYLEKKTGLLKWWCIPATSAIRLKTILDFLIPIQKD